MTADTEKKFYEIRPKWFACECGCGAKATNGALRVFEYSLSSPLAPDIGGLPAQPWEFSCNFQILRKIYGVENPDKDVILIEAAKEAPPMDAVFPLLRLGIEQKCRYLIWERLKFETIDGVKRAVVRPKKFDLRKILRLRLPPGTVHPFALVFPKASGQ